MVLLSGMASAKDTPSRAWESSAASLEAARWETRRFETEGEKTGGERASHRPVAAGGTAAGARCHRQQRRQLEHHGVQGRRQYFPGISQSGGALGALHRS